MTLAPAPVPPSAPPDHRPAPDNPARRQRLRRSLLFAIALLYAAVYKGPGGYVDQFEYMEMAEQVWLHGTWAAPDDSISKPRTASAGAAAPPAPAAALSATDNTPPARFHRYPVGLALIAAPFVYLGTLVNALTGGFIAGRAVLCLLIPVLALVGAALWFEIAADPRCGIGARLPVAAATTLLFALGSTLWNHQRLFYAEVAVTTALLAALYAWLRATHSTGENEAPRSRWLAGAGAALTAAAACHYAAAPICAGLGCVWLYALATRGHRRLQHLAALLILPAAGSGLLLTLNTLRFGAPLAFGYAGYVGAGDWHTANMALNLKYLAFFLVRTAWAPMAIGAAAWIWLIHRPDATPPPAAAPAARQALWPAVTLAFGLQTLFWLGFHYYGMYPLRYGLPMIALAAPGLTRLLAGLHRHGPPRAVAIFTAVGLLWSLAFFLYFDCHYQGVLIQAGDCGLRAFDTDPADGSLRFFTWYMQSPPPAAGQIDSTRLMFAGTAPGAAQWLILSALAFGGIAATVRALWLARTTDRA